MDHNTPSPEVIALRDHLKQLADADAPLDAFPTVQDLERGTT